MSPCVHVISVPSPSLFFSVLPLPRIILNAKQRTKQGRPRNEAKVKWYLLYLVASALLIIIGFWEAHMFEHNNQHIKA